MVCSFGGGTTALILNYCWYGHTIHVGKMVTAVMGSLVSYGGVTFLCSSVETMIIGFGSAILVFFGLEFLDRNNNLDDPCYTFLGREGILIFPRLINHFLQCTESVGCGASSLREYLPRKTSSRRGSASMTMTASYMETPTSWGFRH